MCPNSRMGAGLGWSKMSPIQEHPDQLPLPLESSGSGSMNSNGPTGLPLRSDSSGARMVRHHKGLTDMLVGSLKVNQEGLGIFTALKRDGLEGFIVTLSCALTNSEYATLVSTLEARPLTLGENASVAVRFEPTTPNLVPATTAPST